MTTERMPAPVETVTPIKPSEAIRLGCLVAPVQTFGDFVKEPGSACALGAMVMGYGDESGVPGYDGPVADFESHQPEACPVCDAETPLDLYDGVIVHLNDDHRWSREAIADWLAGLGL